MIKICFIFTFLLLSGCWSTYVQPNKPDLAKVKIVNDSPDMNIVLSTFEDGANCKGLQLFNIPKEMQYAKANMDSQLKSMGVFSTIIDAQKPFFLELDGRMPISGGAMICAINTTLNPEKNGVYEYHYEYSRESNVCKVYVLSVVSETEKATVKSPQFTSRERQATLFNDGVACK